MVDFVLSLHEKTTRLRVRVTGVVQGVGFRPFIYRIAKAHDLVGFVGNNSAGVFIEVEGRDAAVEAFYRQIQTDLPRLALVKTISAEPIAVVGDDDFAIVPSELSADDSTLISADISICDACRRELLDPHNRRYGYPFINCTHCGPRFTIIKDMPYDRQLTTMADFPMCADCRAEYDDPLNRRFHAQPIACPACGPHVWLESAEKATLPNGQAAIQAARNLLREGKVVAVKGVGGFHLACDARHEGAVQQLRKRKGRAHKPLAVMARDLTVVRSFAHVSEAEEALLLSKERPIVLLEKRGESPVTALVAPGQNTVGVMLPYSPLHILLFHPFDDAAQAPVPLLVMTSGNHSSEPIVTDNDAARATLSGLADALLMHNREIFGRCDDSLLRSAVLTQTTILPVRRSRGYAPLPLKLPCVLPPTLAVGGELKATFCLTKGDQAYVSPHIGDLANLETLDAFEAAVSHFQRLFRIAPQRIACDQHPLYLSKRWAERQSVPLITVQHHHAHIAALMAEHQLPGDQPVIGFSFDGTGYGSDGAIWGGELLLADYAGYERRARLSYFPLAGGDTAIKRPYRLALAALWSAGICWHEQLPAVQACPKQERLVLEQQLIRNLNVVPTSSMGRLFDVVASLCGVQQVVTYEGQAAMALEAIADSTITDSYAFDVSAGNVFDATPLLGAVVDDCLNGVDSAVISTKFHNAVANLILQLSLRCRQQTSLNVVALSGGVFQNVLLLKTAVAALRDHQFEVLTHQLVPPNDGGLALGQAIIAGMATIQ